MDDDGDDDDEDDDDDDDDDDYCDDDNDDDDHDDYDNNGDFSKNVAPVDSDGHGLRFWSPACMVVLFAFLVRRQIDYSDACGGSG